MTNYFAKTKPAKYQASDHRQIEITDSLITFIAGDLLPLSVVDSQNFRNLMEKADSRYQMPSRKHMSTKLLHEKSTEIRNNVKYQLQKAKSVCLTIDLWSNRQMKAFMGITGHFILDWSMQSVMVCCSRFKGKHTADNIRHEYEEMVASFEIADKVSTIVSDNASNMVKAFKFGLPGFEGDKLQADEDSDKEVDEEDDLSELDEEEDPFDHIPKHSRCYAHTLQLVVKDGLRDCTSHIKTVIGKASSLVSFVRRSIHASEILEDEGRLQACNATRWNSQMVMIRSVLNVGEDKLKQIDCSVKLSTYERKLLVELSSILEPFEKATLLVQKEKNVSGSLPIPVTLGLKHQIKQLMLTYNNKMISTLKSSLESRFEIYECDTSYMLSSMLDPRFKQRWCVEENVARMTELLKQTVAHINPCSSDDDEFINSPPAKKAKADLFSFMPTTPTSKRVRHQSSGPSEVDFYLGEPCIEMSEDPLGFWKKNAGRFPQLAISATKYLAIPASSAPVERLFSIAGKVFRPDRSRLNDDTFERLMFIKCNGK